VRRAHGGLVGAVVVTLLSSASAQQAEREGSAPPSAPAPPPDAAARSAPARATAPSPPAADDAARTKARSLGYAGVEAYAAGDYSEASAKLEESFQLLPVPSLGLWSARALVGLGRWVAAEQRYRSVAGLPIATSDSPVQQQAKDDALRERTELLRRIPSLKLRVSGASIDEVSVSVDGIELGSSELATALLLDPGRHEIVGARGNERSQVVLSLGERAHEEIELRFNSTPAASPLQPAASASPAAASGAAAATGLSSALPSPSPTSAHPPADAPNDGTRQALRVAAWLGVGVGAAGLATSLVSYALAERQYASFERRSWCEGGSCSQAEVDTYNDLRDVHQLSLIAGGIASAAGATLLVLTWNAPSEQQPAKQQALRLELSPTGAALMGSF
jgi:hypothetical protein